MDPHPYRSRNYISIRPEPDSGLRDYTDQPHPRTRPVVVDKLEIRTDLRTDEDCNET